MVENTGKFFYNRCDTFFTSTVYIALVNLIGKYCIFLLIYFKVEFNPATAKLG